MYSDDLRIDAKLQAGGRTHGLVTGLPREETICPPDSPGFTDHISLPNGVVLSSGSFFRVASPRGNRRFVFRRAHIDSGEVTAWGPINCVDEGWHKFYFNRMLGVLQWVS